MGLRDYFAACMGYANKRQWDPETDLPDLTGKVVVVTGGNTGLGEQTALNLHSKNAKVYVACRSEERALEAIKRINSKTLGTKDKLVYLPFDLTDLDTIKQAAETIKQQETRLDIVVNNAGIMAWPYKIVNGVEVQFWNHLGHFAFVHYLEPLLLKTARENPPGQSVRVVNLASLGHKLMTKPDFGSIDAANKSYGSTWKRYGQAKLANILYTHELQERWQQENIKVNSCHPGLISTELHRGPAASYGKVAQWANKVQSGFLMTIPEGAKTSTYLAGSREVDELDFRGKYFTPIATETQPSSTARDRELAQQLWKISQDFVDQHDRPSA
ncbi:uncharacterized protein JCM15063_000729 [Sporobolomyces koalae]|uniref:uncharacterized protein n=1 Tax=Sporobolomyces koalae TaxID=500713 RepID=UPI0031793667